jgi:ribonuclease HI
LLGRGVLRRGRGHHPLSEYPRKRATVFSDGSSSQGKGPGGWACVIVDGDKHGKPVGKASGGEELTTSSRMEITAACEALERLKPTEFVTLYSDSSYVVNCMRRGWIMNWNMNGWKNSAMKPVANRDLWERLVLATAKHGRVVFVHVKGHTGNPANEMCDRLAKAAKKRVKEAMKP